MHLTPRDVDKLLLHNAGFLAQKRLARGLRLGYPEAVALIATQLLEFIGSVYDLIQWPGVVVLMALETVIFIIPSEAVMTLAGWMLIKDKGLGPEWIVLAGVLGGLGSLWGALWGAIALVYVQVWTDDLAELLFHR